MTDKESLLTFDEVAARVRYNPRTGEFTWVSARCAKHIGKPAGYWLNTGYREIQINNRKILAHRVAWLLMTGSWPSANVDHKDGDTKNNRWKNLRAATQAENARNKAIQRNCKSGVQGVVWRAEKNKWMAYINLNGRFKHIGYFSDIRDAADARRKAALKIHGKFAYVARPQ